MDPLNNYETSNAQRWDTDSVIATSAETQDESNYNIGPSRNQPQHIQSHSAYGLRPQNISQSTVPVGVPIHPAVHSITGHSNGNGRSIDSFIQIYPIYSVPATKQHQNPAPHPTRPHDHRTGQRQHQSGYLSAEGHSTVIYSSDRRTVSGPGGHASQNTNSRGTPTHRSRPTVPARTLWAEPTGLVTTRRAIDREERAAVEAENKRFLKAPDPEEVIFATGIYPWTEKYVKPTELLDWQLTTLNTIRIHYKVHIEWLDRPKHFKISCPSRHNAEENVAGAIKGIREAIDDARAQAKMANPLYLIVPPTATAMRTLVIPREASRNNPRIARIFVLAGEKLSEQEKSLWKAKRLQSIEQNFVHFEQHLTDSLMTLASLKTWMRMRVHLGNLTLNQFTTEFINGEQSVEEFVKMVRNPRMQGTFDKKIGDARTAMRLREKIINWPERFCPADSRAQHLEEIRFKDTAVMMLETGTKNQDPKRYRMEAEIDCTFETIPSEYQIGSVRLFFDNRTDKRIEVTTVNIERALDWQLEVVSDNSIETIPDDFYSTIAESITTRSRTRVDELGLKFPNIRPNSKLSSNSKITQTILRSTIQYMLVDSGHIIEIAIYRQWEGVATQGAPKMAAGVSLFHPLWDSEMASIEGSLRGRDWTPDLLNFFDNGTGLRGLINEVETIQGYLVDTRKEVQDVTGVENSLL